MYKKILARETSSFERVYDCFELCFQVSSEVFFFSAPLRSRSASPIAAWSCDERVVDITQLSRGVLNLHCFAAGQAWQNSLSGWQQIKRVYHPASFPEDFTHRKCSFWACHLAILEYFLHTRRLSRCVDPVLA
jgi:hypothetical protein